MKRVVFFNKKESLDELLKGSGSIVRYAVLEDFIKDRKLASFLDENSSFSKVDLNHYVEEESFKQKYIDFISRLNKNNHSLLWWSFIFPNKHPKASELPKKVWYLLSLEEFIKAEKPDLLAVFTHDRTLISQFSIWHKKGNIKIENKVKRRFDLSRFINSFFPLYISLKFFRTVVYKLCAHLMIPFKGVGGKKYEVIRTLISPQSFQKSGDYKDVYFGELCNLIKESKLPLVIFGTIARPFFSNLIKTSRNTDKFSFVSLEQAVSQVNLLKCFFESLKLYFKPLKLKDSANVYDLNFEFTVKQIISDECKTQSAYSNLLVYYSTLSFAKKIAVKRFFYPFENRSWEKLGLFALRKINAGTEIIGYQHASISPMLMNFYLGKDETSITPLPDCVITMGAVTKDFLSKPGNFPDEILKTGCALRQKKDESPSDIRGKKKKIKNILVPLALSPEEYVNGISFLNRAFKDYEEYNVNLRPHIFPLIPIDKALSYVPNLKFNFSIDKNSNLNKSLRETDLVLYFSTTVSLEALILGIPVININPGFYLNPDPLFNMRDLKWTANTPEALIGIIRDIDAIPEEEYELKKEKAKDYAKNYINPVTRDNMNVFLK